MDIIEYKPEGVCSVLIKVAIENDIIKDIGFLGGCSGNLQGICALCRGMNINDIIKKLDGINCGNKGTSCPDQLAKCLISYIKKQSVSAAK